MQLLDYMKIGERAEHRPAELSGGGTPAPGATRSSLITRSAIVSDSRGWLIRSRSRFARRGSRWPCR